MNYSTNSQNRRSLSANWRKTLEGETKDTVTIRDRDTTEQKRVEISRLIQLLAI